MPIGKDRELTRDEALLALNDHLGDEVEVIVETDIGTHAPIVMSAHGVLSHWRASDERGVQDTRDQSRPTGPGWTMVPPILVHCLRLAIGFRFRVWWRAAAFAGRRSAANRASQIALTLALGRFECGAAGVKSFGVENGPFPGCVGCRQADTVFAHAGDELR